MAANTQAYPLLPQIADVATRELSRLVLDRLNSLEGRASDTAPRRAILDNGGYRIVNLAAPTADGDAVTRKYADDTYGAKAIRAQLEAGGKFPLDVDALTGVLAQPQKMGIRVWPDTEVALPGVQTSYPREVLTWQGKLYYLDGTVNPPAWKLLSSAASIVYDTHANRLTNYLPANQPLGLLFWETDRAALYRVTTSAGVRVWSLMLTQPYRAALASRPVDLGANDAGFLFDQSDDGVLMRWTGTQWNYHRHVYVNTFSNRPAAGSTDEGMLFAASDRGYQVWRFDGTNWILLEGVGGPMRGTISPDQKPSLTANDVGFLFYSTDFDRVYRWDGAAWADAPGQPTRGQIAYFVDNLLPGTGWQLCDGTATTRSTATGGTAAYTVPDLTTTNALLRSVSGATGGTGGSATSGTNSASQEVQVGVGVTVAAHTHTHSVLNPYYEARPYMRL